MPESKLNEQQQQALLDCFARWFSADANRLQIVALSSTVASVDDPADSRPVLSEILVVGRFAEGEPPDPRSATTVYAAVHPDGIVIAEAVVAGMSGKTHRVRLEPDGTVVDLASGRVAQGVLGKSPPPPT